MNKRTIVASLNEIANELDSNGLFKEANEVTQVMVKISQSSGMNETRPGHPSSGDYKREPMPPFDLVEDSPKQVKKTNVGKNPTSKPVSPTAPSKPGSPSSKPGSSDSSTPKSTEGLDRWVNKAENIYNAWGSKGANPNSSAFGLVKDIVDYMDKVKSNLPSSLHGQADAKIARVQEMLRNIFDGAYNPALAMTALPYGVMSGYPKKGVDPFGTGPRLQGNALDYQARQEGKSY